ncbi:MAG: hypothetical protein ACK5BQ_08740, partial [Ignavibacteria bacterium]
MENRSYLDAATAGSGPGVPAGSITGYVWEKSTQHEDYGYTVIDGASSASYDPPPGLTETTYYRRRYIATHANATPGGPSVQCIGNWTYRIKITVNPLPTPSIAVDETSGAANNDGTICNGASVTLTASGAGGGGSYLWSGGLGTNYAVTVTPSST